MKLRVIFVPAAMLVTMPVQARDGLSLQGSIRARVETIDGQPRPGAPDRDTALLLRTTVMARYTRGAFEIGAELADSRSYFNASRATLTPSDVDTVEPIQAYLAWRVRPAISIKAGIQTFDLGSRRLIARNLFRNTINSFTGVVADIGGADSAHATLFWLLPRQRLPDGAPGLADQAVVLDREHGAQQLFGGQAMIPLGPWGRAEGYAIRLAEHDSGRFQTRDRRLWTLGAHFVRSAAPARLDWDVEGAWQGGTARASASASDLIDRRVSAGFAQARLGYTLAAPGKPRLSISYDYASGETGAASLSRFDTLFGARAFDFGPTSLYGVVSRANLSSPSARIEAMPAHSWDVQFTLRGLWLASATDSFNGVRDPSGAAGRHVGIQIDGRVRTHALNGHMRLTLGGAWLDAGRFLRDAPNAPGLGNTLYGYAETAFSF